MTDDAGDPVSWFVIERGWKVLAADGVEIGTVEETVGDSSRDIFDGLTVKTGILDRPRYVPAEKVAEITHGHVRLELSSEQARNLRPHDEPARTERILPEGGSWWTRFLDRVRRGRV